ncbi:tRNA (5-methylaminomethyl-2-thiouridine)(34)-methyltransferase MnmD [Hyphobacterium vulgare]|uniref:tRNA 5-methylaminomethyl-2-thiouridine biosynthesis bifunctional protein MnmC n=1 Tax=Hyphobacterium vulgare TaxID=1736751 RepID=A0ABV6ZWA0_9PROT
MKLVLDPPVLDWQAGGPVAPDYGDVYFSKEDGLAETRAVFLQGCGLPERWRGQPVFTVGELGFGTGLNALALWDLWRREGPASGWLHFVTIEKHPLSSEDARRALSAWPELAALCERLADKWPPALKGAHRIRFDDDRFAITVFHDEAEAALANLEARVDAWFLDGFAPVKNQAMWSDAVFREMARLSAPGAVAATFTVAGGVRRGLQAAGFRVEKKPGHGRKRERLEAVFEGAAPQTPDRFPRTQAVEGPVAIIGGGIAGASLAHALRVRGREAVIFAEGGLASGASGAPAGMLTPRLEFADRPHVRATLAAFEYARALYDGLDGFHPEGVMRMAKDEADILRLEHLAGAMGEGYDFRAHWPGLWMARSGRFEPSRLVHALAGDTPVIDDRAAVFEPSNAGWGLRREDGRVLMLAAQVVHCGGARQARLLSRHQVAMEDDPGRLMVFDANGPVPAHPVTWGGYAAAAPGGILVGATHERYSDARTNEDAEAELRAGAREFVPNVHAALGKVNTVWGEARAATNDRLPVAGALPGPFYGQVWGEAARGGAVPDAAADGMERRMAVLSGLGARGFAHAPLLAEALASDLCGEPSPLERAGRETLHPARFAWRALKKGR